MSADKRWMALAFFAICAFAQGQVGPERKKALLDLLYQDCGACHGLTLKGGLGPPLLPEALQGKPDDVLVRTILEGREGTPMPPWRPFLTAEEARWLVRYLKKGGVP